MKPNHWAAAAGLVLAFLAVGVCFFFSGFFVARKVYLPTSQNYADPKAAEPIKNESDVCDVIDHPERNVGRRVIFKLEFLDPHVPFVDVTLRRLIEIYTGGRPGDPYYKIATKTSYSPVFVGRCGDSEFKIAINIHRDMDIPEATIGSKLMIEFYYDGKQFVAEKIQR